MVNKKLILLKVIPIFILLVSISTAQAVVIWTETFEDTEDWTLLNYVSSGGLLANNSDPDHTFKIIDGILRAPNDSSSLTFNSCNRNSTIAYGSWSFDWWTPDEVGSNTDRAAYDIGCLCF